ncbi:MAG: DUF190 domain-containing protein [Gammaproteobacteria bacterium]|jgi:uncharacterized protein
MKVKVARVYLSEHAKVHEKLMNFLHDEAKVSGATLFRGISGFGRSGHVHTASLLELSLDLPVVVEFFDSPERVSEVIAQLRDFIEPLHILLFDAELV